MQEEILHLETLLTLRLANVAELSSRVHMLNDTLAVKDQALVQEKRKTQCCEQRIEEIAQLLQIVTSDRDTSREDYSQAMSMQTREKEQLISQRRSDLIDHNATIQQLHDIITQEKKNNTALERQLVSERKVSIDMERKVVSLKHELGTVVQRASGLETKLGNIITFVNEQITP
jgi:hypothetical protein